VATVEVIQALPPTDQLNYLEDLFAGLALKSAMRMQSMKLQFEQTIVGGASELHINAGLWWALIGRASVDVELASTIFYPRSSDKKWSVGVNSKEMEVLERF
jgi:hypothetical protein